MYTRYINKYRHKRCIDYRIYNIQEYMTKSIIRLRKKIFKKKEQHNYTIGIPVSHYDVKHLSIFASLRHYEKI